MSKILGGRLHKTHLTITCFSRGITYSCPSFHPVLSITVAVPALPVSAYCCYCLQCAHVKSNKFNNAYTDGMKAKHTRTYPGGWRMKLRIRQVGPKTVAKSSELAVCLAGFFIVWGMPQDASATAAQRRRSRLITMQIWSRRMRNICVCVCVSAERVLCCVVLCCVLFPFAFALTLHTFVRDPCQCAVYSFKHFGKLVINIHTRTHTHAYMYTFLYVCFGPCIDFIDGLLPILPAPF